jgi:hypothetical protein
MLPRIATVTCLLALTFYAAPSLAQPSRGDPARAAFERGMSALRASRYGDAIGELETSYRIEPDPGVLYNLALAYRGAGRNLRSAEAFEQYLREAGASVSPARAAAIREAMNDLRHRLGVVEAAVTPEGFFVSVDGRQLTRWNGSVLVDPGTHVLTFSAPGYREHRSEVAVAPGRRVHLDVALQPMTPEERAGGVARVHVEPSPADADVYLDGQRVGRGSLDQRVTAGPHVIEARAAGHRPFVRSVTVARGDVLRIDAALEREGSVFTRWWFWTIVGAAVTAGTVTAVWALREPEAPYPGTAFNVQVLRIPY